MHGTQTIQSFVGDPSRDIDWDVEREEHDNIWMTAANEHKSAPATGDARRPNPLTSQNKHNESDDGSPMSDLGGIQISGHYNTALSLLSGGGQKGR